MTCAGHYPGEGRPGVPYDMSRCCFFRSGNILADGTKEDLNSSTRLQRLKRSFECREQIGKFIIILLCYSIYRPQTKLRKGNVFTRVCQEFCLHRQTPPWQADTAPQKQTHPWQAVTPWQADTTLAGRPPPGRQTPFLGRYPPTQTPPG